MRLRSHLSFIILFIYTSICSAQYVVDNAVQWYNRTDDDTRHYVYEMGKDLPKEKTAIVLHGGWGAEHSYLIEPLEPISKDYRLVLYDQRGSLRTPAPDSTITITRLVKDLDDLRQSLELDKVTLVAHSAGNHLAYAYLNEHPERVNSLILMSPILPVPFGNKAEKELLDEVWPEGDFEKTSKDIRNFKINALELAKQRALKEGIIPDSLAQVPANEIDFYNIGNDKQRTLAWRIFFSAVNSCSAKDWKDMRGGIVFHDQSVAKAITGHASYAEEAQKFWTSLKNYEGPVHVLIGTCDFVDIGPKIWPRVVDKLEDGHIKIIQNAGHNAWLGNETEFQNTLKSVLDTQLK